MIIVNTSAFKSILVESDGKELRIDEGMKIKFCTEVGEVIQGTLVKITGKNDKTKLQIIPYGAQKHELWEIAVMSEGSLMIDETAQ